MSIILLFEHFLLENKGIPLEQEVSDTAIKTNNDDLRQDNYPSKYSDMAKGTKPNSLLGYDFTPQYDEPEYDYDVIDYDSKGKNYFKLYIYIYIYIYIEISSQYIIRTLNRHCFDFKYLEGGETTDELLQRLLKEHEARLTLKLMREGSSDDTLEVVDEDDSTGHNPIETLVDVEKVFTD